MRHTPGPWALVDGWCDEANLFENQRLCSAAPEMLAALKNVLSFVPYTHIDPDTPEGCAYHIAQAVIAKAEGE